MKASFLTPILLAPRRAFIVAAAAVLVGTTAFAQSTTTSSRTREASSSDSSYSNNSNSDRPGTTETSATGSGYHSGKASADADAATEINAQIREKTGAAGEPAGHSNKNKLSWGDRRFVTKVADAGHAELQIAQLAADKATNPEVRNFAQKLVDDHSKVSTELTSIAEQKNVEIDKDDDHDRAYRRLSKKSGHDFDQEFVEHMIEEHEKDIKMFEKAAKDAKDEDVRSFASKHVDHLREHLRSAESLRQTVMPTGRMDSNSGRNTSSGLPQSQNYSTAGSASNSDRINSTDTNLRPTEKTNR